ncbi:MAG: hypothetical protein II639_04015 [Clostridia bacterium]|nr:hypothetical protein [Clostridia bacterium]
MAKKKIEIQEPELEVVSIDLEENEGKPIWYRTGIWATVAAIGGIASAVLYGIWKSSKESPEPAVDMFKAPTQPIIPHVEAEPVVTKTIVEEPKVEEPKKEEPKKEAPKAAPKKAPAKKAAPATDGKFVGNSDSLVYHTLDCRYGKRISEQNKVFLKTKAAATKGGYKPCSYCNP